MRSSALPNGYAGTPAPGAQSNSIRRVTGVELMPGEPTGDGEVMPSTISEASERTVGPHGVEVLVEVDICAEMLFEGCSSSCKHVVFIVCASQTVER